MDDGVSLPHHPLPSLGVMGVLTSSVAAATTPSGIAPTTTAPGPLGHPSADNSPPPPDLP